MAGMHAHAGRLAGALPQGHHDCFDAFVADRRAASRGEHHDDLPVFDDGFRATVITDVVPEPAGTGGWIAC
ncbi:hypothetical protein ACRYCC_35005 [Actinomadura scrupuli]|uniref:hypothetical protein n=1 Tax=Actinomadura scrupuli TaxID=559629 RepID=UPI003D952EFC